MLEQSHCIGPATFARPTVEVVDADILISEVRVHTAEIVLRSIFDQNVNFFRNYLASEVKCVDAIRVVLRLGKQAQEE